MWIRIRGWLANITMLVVSGGLGAVAINQVFEASRLLVPILIPVDSMATSSWNRLAVTLPRVLLVVLGILWFGGVIIGMNVYTRTPLDLRRTWRVFLWTALVEVALIALGTLTLYGAT